MTFDKKRTTDMKGFETNKQRRINSVKNNVIQGFLI